MKKIASVWVLFIFFFNIEIVYATSLYISDKNFVPVRRGQGNQYAIIHRGLPSGTEVTLVKRGRQWSKIKTQSGLSGWVRTQYLLEEPTANVLLEKAQKELETLNIAFQQMKAEKNTLSTQLLDIQQTLSNEQERRHQTHLDYTQLKELSRTAVNAHEHAKQLTQELEALKADYYVLEKAKDNLEKSQRNIFFLYGAFAVLLGVIITLIIPRLRRQKRNSNGWAN